MAEWESTPAPPVAFPALVSRGMTEHFTFDGSTNHIHVEKGAPVFREGVIGKAATVGGRGQFNLGAVGEVLRSA